MRSFDEVARKETCELYSLKIPKEKQWQCMWAKIFVDSESWSFSCLSDAGNFSYRWPVEDHRTFKELLTEIDMGYLIRKIDPKATVFDFEETVKSLKKTLFELRYSKSISKIEARKVYFLITHLEYENSEDLVIYQLIEGHNFFGNDLSWTCGQMVKKHNPGALVFTELVFPLLQEALKIELAEADKEQLIEGETHE